MKKCIPQIIVLAAISGWIMIAENRALAQANDPLLADSLDQLEFPQVTAQPVDQTVPIGANAVLKVQAVDADSYQWLRNGVAIEGQTNDTLIIEQVSVEDAGSYACDVSQAGGEPVPTRAASLSIVVPGADTAAAALPGGGPITVYGLPKASSGTQGTCPGSYAGYISYTRTISQGWGWAPATNSTTVFIAADGGGRTDTKIVYAGKNGDTGCGQTMVVIPDPPYSPRYRFAIYFPNNVPATNYPIILTGFDP